MSKISSSMTQNLGLIDWMGYLAPGSLVLYSLFLLDKDGSIAKFSTGSSLFDGILLLFFGYITGHIVMWISRFLLIKPTNMIWGNPAKYLLTDVNRKFRIPHDDFNIETKRLLANLFEKAWSKEIVYESGDFQYFCRILVQSKAPDTYQNTIMRFYSQTLFYRSLVLSVLFLGFCLPIEPILKVVTSIISAIVCFRGYCWYRAVWLKHLYTNAWFILKEEKGEQTEQMANL